MSRPLDIDVVTVQSQVVYGCVGNVAAVPVLQGGLLQVAQVPTIILVNIDPVLGDQDTGIYTHPGMVEGWRDLLSLATGLTPNAFELGVLSGMPVDTSAQVAEAARSLISGRTKWVIATSAAPQEWEPGSMNSVIVTADGARTFRHERVDSAVKGTGDMFTAGIVRALLNGSSLEAAAQEAGERVVLALNDSSAADSEELVMRRRF